jgi:peptidoglycan hydrolase CwlO-like protein
MKKLLFVIIIILVAGYILNNRFDGQIPNAEELQGNLLEIKTEIQDSVTNAGEEIEKLKNDFTETKENIEDKIEKVENVINAVNDLTE